MRRSWGKWFHGAAAAALLNTSMLACSDGASTGNTTPDKEEHVRQPPDTTTDRAVFDEKNMALSLEDDGTVSLDVAIGNPGDVAVQGTVSVGLRDLDGNAIGNRTSAFTATPGGSTLSIALTGLAAGTARSDLIKYVLDYQIDWKGGNAKGSRSAFDALRKLQVILMTDDRVELGNKSHLSLFAIDPATARALKGAKVMVKATAPDGTTSEQAFETDEAGAANGDIALPPGVTVGETKIVVTVEANGAVESEEIPVQVVRNQKILLTTDKPLYQPGQTVHVRALALRQSDKTPEAAQDLVFEVEDSKGNKIARETVKTDAFGIASTTLKLAREPNMGAWTLRASLGGTVSEKTVSVERYVLPKFKVDARLDAAWYRPGAEVTVTGDVRYFFGKAVQGGSVRVIGSTFDVDFTQFAEIVATTSAEGAFSATLQVPAYVVGQALEQGKGLLKIDIVATDTAGQEVRASKTAAVAKGAVDVTLVPESGKLVPGLANTVYVVTADPTGGPLAADVAIRLDGQTLANVTTNAQGMGQITLTPSGTGTLTLEVQATAGKEVVTLSKVLGIGTPSETVLLRADKAVYGVGDTVNLEVRVGEAKERVWLDIVSDGRTVALETLEVADGVAKHAFDIDATLEGELRIGAYYVGETGTLIRDTQVVFVQPKGELKVTMTPERKSYLPGETAKVDVEVKDENGAGVASAVGLQIVDEAVFALQEVQPGLLKVFFNLAAELASASVSPACGGCDTTSIVEGGESDTPVYEDKAKIAFASVDLKTHGVERDSYDAQVSAVAATLKPFIDAEKVRVSAELLELVNTGVVTQENFAEFAESADLAGVDFWGHGYVSLADENATLTITSSGPDERAGSDDDFSFQLGYWDVYYGGRGWGMGGDFADGGAEMDGDFAGGAPMPGAPPQAPNAGPTKAETTGSAGEEAGPRVRSYFPETLYVNPALITDGNGKGAFSVDIADSITTWRMTGLASAKSGLLGSGVGDLLVFQDFFADIDFPVAITRNDAFSAPIAVYNYLPEPQTVTLALEDAEWFEVNGPTTKTLTLQPNQVAAVSFDIRALSVGVHGLTIVATGKSASDAVKRTVEVRPDGKEFPTTHSARFASDPEGKSVTETITKTISIPANNIDGAESLMVKVYPGFMSQVVEGIDSILRLPGGCFEQTTASAWPNVLVTDFLDKTGTLNPETAIRAREYIASGYQQLVAFECQSGGFNWWVGDDPGNSILTAISLLMFTDTRNVSFVDDAIVARSAQWLADRQQSDGSWTEERHLHAGNENLGAGSVRASAYITWSLIHSTEQNAAVQKAIPYLRQAIAKETDIYTIALGTLALGLNDSNDSALTSLVQKLHEARIEDKDHTYWTPDGATMVGGFGDNGNIETTALVSLALMNAGAYSADVQGALNFLIASKDPAGNWGYSTQATVLTLKALIASLSAGAPNTAATVTVKLDGEVVGERTFNDDNADVLWQLELPEAAHEGDNVVTIEYAGVGNLMWQVSAAHYIPWTEVAPETTGPLAIDVKYDKTTLATNDAITVSVNVTNSDAAETGMMMAELGLPPGFDLEPALLDALVGHGQVAKYEVSAMKLVVYLEPIKPEAPVSFQYQLRARYPLEATAPKSEAYLYYNKTVKAESSPVLVQVQ